MSRRSVLTPALLLLPVLALGQLQVREAVVPLVRAPALPAAAGLTQASAAPALAALVPAAAPGAALLAAAPLGACPSNPLRTTDGGVGSVVVDRSDAKSVRGLRQAA